MPIPSDLLDILCCPKCHTKLLLREPGDGLECQTCRVVFPIVDDIPQLLIEEARPIEG